MKNVRIVQHQGFEDIIHCRDAAQEESVHTPGLIRVVRIALRCALAAAFLSAVADRFGLWGAFWGRVAGGAWLPSPTMPTSLFRLLLVGFRPSLSGVPPPPKLTWEPCS